MPADEPGRLLLWPSISPQGHTLPRPAYYLSWPGWEKHRLTCLDEKPVYEGFTPIFIDEPENFSQSLAQLREATRDDGIRSFRTPFYEQDYPELRAAILSYEGPRRSAKAAFINKASPYLRVALWSASESLHFKSRTLLRRAIAEKNAMMFSMRGSDALPLPEGVTWRPQGYDPFTAPYEPTPEPPPEKPRTPLHAAWLELARPILKEGDLLWPAKIFNAEDEY
jgi:hypothetical protein